MKSLIVVLVLAATMTPRARAQHSELRFTLGTAVADSSPLMLSAWIIATNRGAKSIGIAYGGCPIRIRLWRTADRKGPPAWKSEYREPRGQSGDSTRRPRYACPGYRIEGRLLPNDRLVFRQSIPLAEVLADSLSEGRYWVGLELKLRNEARPRGEWERPYTFTAGDVMLRRP